MFCSAPLSASALRGKTPNSLGLATRDRARAASDLSLIRGGLRLRVVLQYTFVTADEEGNEVVVAQGEYTPGVNAWEVGDSVTLEGADGVEKSWKILRMIPVPYAGVSFYVEPAG